MFPKSAMLFPAIWQGEVIIPISFLIFFKATTQLGKPIRSCQEYRLILKSLKGNMVLYPREWQYTNALECRMQFHLEQSPEQQKEIFPARVQQDCEDFFLLIQSWFNNGRSFTYRKRPISLDTDAVGSKIVQLTTSLKK